MFNSEIIQNKKGILHIKTFVCLSNLCDKFSGPNKNIPGHKHSFYANFWKLHRLTSAQGTLLKQNRGTNPPVCWILELKRQPLLRADGSISHNAPTTGGQDSHKLSTEHDSHIQDKDFFQSS